MSSSSWICLTSREMCCSRSVFCCSSLCTLAWASARAHTSTDSCSWSTWTWTHTHHEEHTDQFHTWDKIWEEKEKKKPASLGRESFLKCSFYSFPLDSHLLKPASPSRGNLLIKFSMTLRVGVGSYSEFSVFSQKWHIIMNQRLSTRSAKINSKRSNSKKVRFRSSKALKSRPRHI